MAAKIPRHKVFISFHEKDKRYRDQIVRMLGDDIVDKSVHDEDIDDRLKTSTIRQKIRDEFIADASVTVVLIGPDTCRRKHVDWEIGSSIRKTKKNSRCGLLSILLPNHPNYNDATYDSALIPPRLADNCIGEDPYAKIYRWEDLNKPGVKAKIRRWIDEAFKRKDGTPPNNGREPFGKNRSPEAKQESKFRGQVANPFARVEPPIADWVDWPGPSPDVKSPPRSPRISDKRSLRTSERSPRPYVPRLPRERPPRFG